MTSATPGREWDELRAERAAARAELRGTLDALAVRARDPFRIKETIRRHPVLSAGVAAAAGAVLVNLLLRGGGGDGKREPGDAGDAADAAPSHGPSPLDALRDVALRVATPWVARWVTEHLGGGADAAAPEEGGDDDG